MKKIILILILFLSIWFIYNNTFDEKINYLVLGNDLSVGDNNYSLYVKDYLDKKNIIGNYNTSFVDLDLRITDLINKIKYNESVKINNKTVGINMLLKNADIITISIGMNELYYKLSINNENIYTYMKDMINDLEVLFNLINRYNHKRVFVINYYNIYNYNKDIFDYLNYYLEILCDKEGFEYVDVSEFLDNNIINYEKSSNFYLNKYGNKIIGDLIVNRLQIFSMKFVIMLLDKKRKMVTNY